MDNYVPDRYDFLTDETPEKSFEPSYESVFRSFFKSKGELEAKKFVSFMKMHFSEKEIKEKCSDYKMIVNLYNSFKIHERKQYLYLLAVRVRGDRNTPRGAPGLPY